MRVLVTVILEAIRINYINPEPECNAAEYVNLTLINLLNGHTRGKYQRKETYSGEFEH